MAGGALPDAGTLGLTVGAGTCGGGTTTGVGAKVDGIGAGTFVGVLGTVGISGAAESSRPGEPVAAEAGEGASSGADGAAGGRVEGPAVPDDPEELGDCEDSDDPEAELEQATRDDDQLRSRLLTRRGAYHCRKAPRCYADQ